MVRRSEDGEESRGEAEKLHVLIYFLDQAIVVIAHHTAFRIQLTSPPKFCQCPACWMLEWLPSFHRDRRGTFVASLASVPYYNLPRLAEH